MRKLCVAALIGAALWQFGPRAAAQEPVAVFKSSVAVVPIGVVVHDARGRIVTTLRRGDFQVLDKGEPRRIIDFRAEQDSPLTLAVLLDTSGSMRVSSKFTLARDVVKQLGSDLQEGRDEVSVLTFDASLRVRQPFTAHPASLDEALDTAEPFGTTSLYDAIAATARRLGDRPSPRRAILVLTDGIDTSSSLTAAEVSGLASSIDVPVYVVATVAPIDRAMYEARAETVARTDAAGVRDLAAWTGGDLYWVTREDEAVAQARAIVSELRHEYLITVESATAPEWRPIEVRVRNHRLAVRARSGYFSR